MATFNDNVKNAFPSSLPIDDIVDDTHRRLEDGWEVLEVLRDVTWQNFDMAILYKVCGEYYQLSMPWQRYFLPAFINLGLKLDVKNEDDTDEYDAAFSYSGCIKDLNSQKEVNIQNNVFIGLTDIQLNLVASWMSIMREKLPEVFDFSEEELVTAIERAKTSM